MKNRKPNRRYNKKSHRAGKDEKICNIQVELDIDGLTHDGRGIGRVEGKTVFVSGALPEEKVRAKIIKQKKRFDEAVLEEILQSSPHRVPPKCEYFGKCGGCSLQHLETGAQIQYKENHLRGSLQRVGGLEIEELFPAITGRHWQYRRKARLATSFDKREKVLSIGFREKESAKFISISHCEVLEEPFNIEISKISHVLNQLEKRQFVSHIDIVKAENKNVIVIRHVKALNDVDIALLQQYSKQESLIIYLQGNDQEAVNISDPTNPDLLFTLPSYDLIYHFQPKDFIQVNVDINQKMLALALECLELGTDDVVLDLFCGLGNFSLPIAQRVNKVVGIEGGKDMVDRARLNAERNGIKNVEFHCADLTQEIRESAWYRENKFSKVILDPPRSGAFEQMAMLAKLKPEKILYVSCDAATLARDLAELVGKSKYHVTQVGVLDMFPHTSHVESIALLERKKK